MYALIKTTDNQLHVRDHKLLYDIDKIVRDGFIQFTRAKFSVKDRVVISLFINNR